MKATYITTFLDQNGHRKKMNRRSDLKPWARRIPAFVLLILLVVTFTLFILIALWEGGIKECLVGRWN